MSIRTPKRRRRATRKRSTPAPAKAARRSMVPAARKDRPRHRSGFEASLRARLDRECVKYEYEAQTYPIILDTPGYCSECGSKSVARKSRYTPDFFFRVWVVEAKGKFTARDRKRVLALLAANPDLKFAMLFQRDNWVTGRHKSRYSDWCREHNIPCAVGWFDKEWLK